MHCVLQGLPLWPRAQLMPVSVLVSRTPYICMLFIRGQMWMVCTSYHAVAQALVNAKQRLGESVTIVFMFVYLLLLLFWGRVHSV